MRSRRDMTLHLLDYAHQTMRRKLQGITLEEALFVPVGGYRSVLGTVKHAAGWSQVYHSYAFDPHPRPWAHIDWPHGQRDRIIPSEQYLHDVLVWFDDSHRRWMESLARVGEDQVGEPRPVHWGQRAPLYEIVVMIAGHHIYHAGELNQLLSIYRGEAWEETEDVEENHIATVGHRVKPPWLDDTGA